MPTAGGDREGVWWRWRGREGLVHDCGHLRGEAWRPLRRPTNQLPHFSGLLLNTPISSRPVTTTNSPPPSYFQGTRNTCTDRNPSWCTIFLVSPEKKNSVPSLGEILFMIQAFGCFITFRFAWWLIFETGGDGTMFSPLDMGHQWLHSI